MQLLPNIGAIAPPLVVVFALAAAVSLLLTPFVRDHVRARGMVDRPNARRVNTIAIPRGGGLAVAAAFLVVAITALVLDGALGPAFANTPFSQRQLIGLLGGAAAAAVIGAFDDVFDLRARWQLAGQVALALGAVWLGIGVFAIANPFGPGAIVFEDLFAAGFTVLWIVGMINSINFIDGLDGLSSGIAFVAAVTLGVLSLTTTIGQPIVALLCFALAGALLGFLRWNVHPASVFIGTSGVMFVGFTLAVLAILGTAKVVVAMLVLGVPIIDTFWVIVRRLAGGRSPFSPDRGHLHHRLLDLGLSHRQTVTLIVAICVFLGLIALGASTAAQIYTFLGVLVGSGLILFLVTRGNIAAEALEAGSYEPDDETG
ncbi:MAG: undecaprenyl/decaprenyl-phosphate alpha-N-acetylglucosaminyl 1-phosphate transferase [Chloroflexi bacterium]|nr:undecaprenyl/decaprenyl-phosphate alpha-N-acetylglucosaminyl 1-phosphate transferase [Chloroflexota bacterium]